MDLPFDVSQISLRGQSAIGLGAFVFIAWLLSENKLRFPVFGRSGPSLRKSPSRLCCSTPRARETRLRF